MSGKKIVVALGGNALGNTPAEQEKAVFHAAKAAADLVADGHVVVLGHGNGPQVGMISLAFGSTGKNGGNPVKMPFPECTAMSQGYIGFHLQKALQEELTRREILSPVVSVVTQVRVDAADPAFQRPDKPIGAFCSAEEAERTAKETGWTFMEDAGRGYRRIVPSPMPVEIMELEGIRRMLDAGITVITVGGGGIPVVRTENGLRGIDAVIDKDRASEKLAEDIGADILMILTAVDRAYLHFGKEDQTALHDVTAEEAAAYIREGQFAPGSMLPKMEAAVRFVRSAPGRSAVITSLDRAGRALSGEEGTWIRE